MRLSVVIPVYNERSTLPRVLASVVESLPDVPKEIILVDDGSTDGTGQWLHENFDAASSQPVPIGLEGGSVCLHLGAKDAIRILTRPSNEGKGAALRDGFERATGEIIVIQDADLEYDPRDWATMWELFEDGSADIVYGSRFSSEPHRVFYIFHYIGNRIISTLVNLLCNTTLSDVEVGIKMFRREVLENLRLASKDFGFEVEFTMKVARAKRWRIYEMGTAYRGRTYAEGKKVTWRDGLLALWYILKYRFFSP